MKFDLFNFRDVFSRRSKPEPDVPFTLDEKNTQANLMLDWLQLMCKTVETRIHAKLSPDVRLTTFAPAGSLEFFMIKSPSDKAKPSQEFPLMVRLSVHTSHMSDPYFSLLIKGPSPGFLSDMDTRETLVKEEIPFDRAHEIHPHIIREVLGALDEKQREELNVTLWPWSFADLISNTEPAAAAPPPPAVT